MSFISDFLQRKIVTKDTGEETYLTWKETLGYGMGRGAQGMSTSIMNGGPANFFITNVFGIEPGTAAKIKLFTGFWDALNDPILGSIVDRTRTKYGKMRPYIKWAPFISAFFTSLYFSGQADWDAAFKALFMVVAFVGWDMSYTAVDVPMGALAFSITPNGIERVKLFGISNIMRMILGSIAGGIVSVAVLFERFKGNPAPAYFLAAIVASAGMILLTRPAFYWTRERAKYSDDTPKLLEQLSLLFQNKPLFMLVISNILFIFVTLPSAMQMYFAVDMMGDGKFTVPLTMATAPAGFLSGIIFPMIAERMGKRMDFRKFYMLCCAAAAGAHLTLLITSYNPIMKNTGVVSWGVAILVCFQIMLTVIPLEFKNICAKQMEAMTVDYIERKTTQRAEGVMLSVMSFTGKLQNSAASAVVLWLLELSNYVTHTDTVRTEQPESARLALFAMYTVIPAAAWLLMMIPIWFFNVDNDKEKSDKNLQAVV
ncbi:MAG: MFS transporter [Oscillospiraceae bacterium]|nr:MFS transporter [Oscillospiraceae bacterium]